MSNINRDKDPQILQNIAYKRWRRKLKSKAKAKQRRKQGPKIDTGIFLDDEHFDREYEAPADFSFHNNRSAVLNYIAKLEKNLYKERSLFANLKEILTIDLEAIVLLLGIMAEYNTMGIKFNGFLPDDEISRKN